MAATATATGTAQAASKSVAAEQRVPGWKQLARLIPYLGRYKGGMTFGLLTLVAMGLVGNIVPLLMGVIFDCIGNEPKPLSKLAGRLGIVSDWMARYYRPLDRHTLAIFCLVLIVAIALKGVFSFLTRWVLIGVSREIEYDIRNDLLAQLLQLEPEFYVRNRTGELMSRCTNDLNNVRMVLGPGIMYSATTIVTFILAVAVMTMISPTLTLLVLVPVPVVALAVRYFGQIIHNLFEKIQASLATLSAHAQENFSGVRVIRAYVQEQVEIGQFDATNREYVAKNMKLILAWSMFMPALTALIGMTFILVLWQGGRLVMIGRITLGEWVAFYTFLGQLIWPMVALGWVTNIFQRGAASMGRLNYIFDAQPKINDAAEGYQSVADESSPIVQSAPRVRGEIEFRHLNFAYPTAGNGAPAPIVLKDVNLRIPAGSTLAIVGPTGSGKSTFAALAARLWEAPEGTVLLDGRSIREWPLATLRRALGFVPQDTFLFSESLAENIAFGVDAARTEQIETAAQIASICGEIMEFPDKFQTMIGERGLTLSGGQKQRTALARAVVRDPQILILDDALSSVDTETEEKILERLREIMKG
ncbi:MAG TPA: ABC transporter ATP-binding protein, partial [Candidatus Acidoferrales bacterium]|nr:ABC transporter ATP-binding protein [Candidatus Acidoferrales bacterium]